MKVPGGLNAQRLIAVLEDGLLREEKYQPNLKCLAGRKVSKIHFLAICLGMLSENIPLDFSFHFDL